MQMLSQHLGGHSLAAIPNAKYGIAAAAEFNRINLEWSKFERHDFEFFLRAASGIGCFTSCSSVCLLVGRCDSRFIVPLRQKRRQHANDD